MKTVDQFLADLEKLPKEPAIIEGLLTDSSQVYMLICGKAGIGKSMLALNLAFCIATGTKFLSYNTNRKRVGYLSFEGASEDTGKRICIIRQNYPSTDGWLCCESIKPKKLIKDGITEIEKIITGLDVVIADPLRFLVSGKYMEPDVASNFLIALREVQNDTGTTFILTHHVRKKGRGTIIRPEDLQDEIKGPSEYVDGADTVLLLTRPEQQRDKDGQFIGYQAEKALYLIKVRNGPANLTPLNLRFREDTFGFEPLTNQYEDT